MFNSIYSNGIDKAVNYRLMLYGGIIAVLTVCTLTTIFVLRVELQPDQRLLILYYIEATLLLWGLPMSSSIMVQESLVGQLDDCGNHTGYTISWQF